MPELPSNPPPVNDWHAAPPAVRAIHARLCQVLPQVALQLRPEQDFRSTGGDSIDFVELLCAIEADYGVRLTDEEIAGAANFREMLVVVDRRATRRPAAPPP